MMQHTLNFTFHQIVRLRLHTDDKACADFFRAEYRPYLSTRANDTLPLVHLTFYHRRRRETPFTGVSFSHKLLARWVYGIEITTNEVHLQVQGNRWAIPMVHHMLVHPSLRLLAARQGVLMLHAGAVAFRERSIVLTGSGGVGKTTTTSLLLAQSSPQWALHADDYVFLSPDGRTFSYLTRSHLHQPLLSWVPEVRHVLTTAERLKLRLLWLLRRGSQERLKWPVRLDAQRLWPQREHREMARLKALVWLQRQEATQATITPFSPSAEDLDRLLKMNFHEARHFITLLHACHTLDQEILPPWREQERALLTKIAQQVPWYRLSIPSRHKDVSFLPLLQDLMGDTK